MRRDFFATRILIFFQKMNLLFLIFVTATATRTSDEFSAAEALTLLSRGPQERKPTRSVLSDPNLKRLEQVKEWLKTEPHLKRRTVWYRFDREVSYTTAGKLLTMAHRASARNAPPSFQDGEVMGRARPRRTLATLPQGDLATLYRIASTLPKHGGKQDIITTIKKIFKAGLGDLYPGEMYSVLRPARIARNSFLAYYREAKKLSLIEN